MTSASVEHTAIGRIVVPPHVPDGYRVFYTTLDFDGAIDHRIRDFLKPAALFSCHQVHGKHIEPAKNESGHHEPECDARWSDRENTALAIKMSDCLPVSIIDPKNSVFANVHSGWRGAVQHIVAAALDAAPLDPRESLAFFGPSIRVCCFEVGEEVASQFDEQFIDRTLGPKPHVDIAAFTRAFLRERGFAGDRIIDSGLCTRCDRGVAGLSDGPSSKQPFFHSYRRDKRTGRNLAVVVRR